MHSYGSGDVGANLAVACDSIIDCAVLLIGIEYIKLMLANYVICELQVWTQQLKILWCALGTVLLCLTAISKSLDA